MRALVVVQMMSA